MDDRLRSTPVEREGMYCADHLSTTFWRYLSWILTVGKAIGYVNQLQKNTRMSGPCTSKGHTNTTYPLKSMSICDAVVIILQEGMKCSVGHP